MTHFQPFSPSSRSLHSALSVVTLRRWGTSIAASLVLIACGGVADLQLGEDSSALEKEAAESDPSPTANATPTTGQAPPTGSGTAAGVPPPGGQLVDPTTGISYPPCPVAGGAANDPPVTNAGAFGQGVPDGDPTAGTASAGTAYDTPSAGGAQDDPPSAGGNPPPSAETSLPGTPSAGATSAGSAPGAPSAGATSAGSAPGAPSAGAAPAGNASGTAGVASAGGAQDDAAPSSGASAGGSIVITEQVDPCGPVGHGTSGSAGSPQPTASAEAGGESSSPIHD